MATSNDAKSSTTDQVSKEIDYRRLHVKKPKMHCIAPATCWASAAGGQERLGTQIRETIRILESQLFKEGNLHVLQLILSGDNLDDPRYWELYADAYRVASGDGDYAFQCFCEGAEVFLNVLHDAVDAACKSGLLVPLSEREYKLLKTAHSIARIEKRYKPRPGYLNED